MQVDLKKLILFTLIGLFVIVLILGSLGYLVISNFTAQGPKGKKNIAVINVSGPITSSGRGSFFNGIQTGSKEIMSQINRAKDDEKIKAIILRVNSPGGSSAASDAIYRELKKFEETKKPVVVSMADIAASGGYYISAIADQIYANPSTITGSIGVIMQFQNLQELYDKLGIDSKVFKSGPYKDMGNPDRKLTSEEKNILQNMVNDVYQEFIKAVSEGRDMPKSKVKEIADGRIFTGKKAKELGLVDKLGTFYDAVEKTAKLAGIKGEPNLIYYNQASPLERLLNSINKLVINTLLGESFNSNQNFNSKDVSSNVRNSEMLYYKFIQKSKKNQLQNFQLQY